MGSSSGQSCKGGGSSGIGSSSGKSCDSGSIGFTLVALDIPQESDVTVAVLAVCQASH